ncbi:LysE/ArgO family amino acid transporter [Metabacillus iocasae]|uniref:L-lysine exporter family protein LysE/ArgO n=1 Tax=Priestia iocasae TaxID=2291674 RepID=A0ABS2QYD9_9BACI|nr:LysE family transporter [Metabacillus iocasae]MBM7703489.1 L-lysine exporter family protein LysE/ArgO [Metabacillus iocasae]
MNGFIHGFILAFGLILPMGVQNLFIFNQGLQQPTFKRAMPAVLTASTCDTILIVVSVFSLHIVADFFESVRSILVIGGALFLLYMGWVIWHTQSPVSGDKTLLTPKKQIVFALSVSLLNPHALLDTIGVIGTNSLIYTNEKMLFMLGTIMVSWLYFFLLAFVGRVIGRRDPHQRFQWLLARGSALTIWGMALYMVFSSISMEYSLSL